MTLTEAYENFILSRQLADLSPKTITNYEEVLTPFINALGTYLEVEQLTQELINRYIAKLLKKPLSKASKATYIRHLKVFLKWIQGNYTVVYDYEQIKVPKCPKKNVKIYTNDELFKIIDNVHSESEWLTYRNKCILALMYDSGIRQSEVCNLQRRCISYQERRMTVYGKGNKERTVPLGNLAYYFMQQYFDSCPYNSDRVFVNRHGEPLTCNAVKLLVSKLSKELKFELSSHKLRHNFATNYCIDQYEKFGQVDIYRLMIIMGHEDVETTRRYLHHANEIIGCKNNISHLDKIFSGDT